MQHLPEFIENLQYGKQIDDFLDIQKCQKRPQARKPIFLGLGSGKSENMVPNFEIFENYIKDAPTKTVQNGSYTSPNELTRFPNEAKPIWGRIQKHCKNVVIIQMGLQLLKLKTISYGTFCKWTYQISY